MQTKDELEIARLESNSGWRFRDSDRALFRDIRSDVEAQHAFEKLTKGRRAIRPAVLLLNLGSEFCPRDWKEWEAWKDKWAGLSTAAKTIRLVEAKMKRHVGKSNRGPVPLPIMAGTEKGDKDYIRSHRADSRLRDICKTLAACAAEIEEYCQMRRNWLREVPRKNATQKERIVLFMRFVKEKTGKWYFERVAALLNVGRKINARNEITAETLRKLRKLRTPLLDRLEARTGKT